MTLTLAEIERNASDLVTELQELDSLTATLINRAALALEQAQATFDQVTGLLGASAQQAEALAERVHAHAAMLDKSAGAIGAVEAETLEGVEAATESLGEALASLAGQYDAAETALAEGLARFGDLATAYVDAAAHRSAAVAQHGVNSEAAAGKALAHLDAHADVLRHLQQHAAGAASAAHIMAGAIHGAMGACHEQASAQVSAIGGTLARAVGAVALSHIEAPLHEQQAKAEAALENEAKAILGDILTAVQAAFEDIDNALMKVSSDISRTGSAIGPERALLEELKAPLEDAMDAVRKIATAINFPF